MIVSRNVEIRYLEVSQPLKRMEQKTIEQIVALVGSATPGQMAYVECHVTDKVGIFLPLGGACAYAMQPNHTHPSWMFTISYDGMTAVKVGTEVITPPKNSLFVVAPGIFHTELPSEAPPNYLAIFITPGFLEEQRQSFDRAYSLPLSHSWAKANPQITALARNFILELGGQEPGYETVVDALTIQLVQLLLRNLIRDGGNRTDTPRSLDMDRIAAYLSANLSRSITVGGLSREMGYAPSRLTPLFRQKTGLTPSVFIAQFRLKAAKRLLLQSAKSLTEIAHECGFSSSAHFSYRFSKEYGTTPNAYRKRLGG